MISALFQLYFRSLRTSARVALAVRSTFAAILSNRGFTHLHGAEACLLRSHPKHQSLSGCAAFGVAHVWVHLATSTAVAALAARSTATVSSTARHD